MFPAQSAPLGFLTTALDTIADAFVFLISFILGAVLQKGPGPGTRSLGWLPILMTVLNRFLFLPALGALSAAAHVRCAHFDSSRPISPGRRLFHADKILVHLNVCHQSSGMIGWAGLRECVVCRCGVDFWFAPPRLVAAARPAIHLYHVDDECDAHWQPNSGMHSPRAMFDTAKLLMWAQGHHPCR